MGGGRRTVSTDEAPPAVGPYSQAVGVASLPKGAVVEVAAVARSRA